MQGGQQLDKHQRVIIDGILGKDGAAVSFPETHLTPESIMDAVRDILSRAPPERAAYGVTRHRHFALMYPTLFKCVTSPDENDRFDVDMLRSMLASVEAREATDVVDGRLRRKFNVSIPLVVAPGRASTQRPSSQ